MAYVCTLMLPAINWTLRVDTATTLAGTMARYRRTDEKGDEDQYSYPIGPDTHGVGMDTIAIVDLIRDLNWNNIGGAIYVVHAGSIDQEGLEMILAQVHPAYRLRNLATSASIN